MQQQKESEEFCHRILNMGTQFPKGLASLVMSLSSNRFARSAVELSENPLYQHSYSSISQVVSTLSGDKSSHNSVQSALQLLYNSYFSVQETYILQTDVSPIEKPHSKKMGERHYIHTPNHVVPGEKALGVGHDYSYINLGYIPPQGGHRWSLPFDIERVRLESNAISTALEQTHRLMANESLPFGKARLVINEADSGYATPRFIEPLVSRYTNLALVIRFRNSSKVWQQVPQNTDSSIDFPILTDVSTETTGKKKVGARSIYGKTTYYLQLAWGDHTTKNGKTKEVATKYRDTIYDLVADETLEINETTSKGRKVIVLIKMWKNMMIRTKKGNNMKDKPFNLVGVQVIDEITAELLFKKPMFIAVFGTPKDSLSALLGYQSYRQRYDIEVHNRFSKHQLFLDKYQTPDVQTLDNWTLIVACAFWLLFVASAEVELMPKPWERNLPQYKQAPNPIPTLPPQKSVAQTKKAAFDLFYTFDLNPFAPKSVKNGKGRIKGAIFNKRTSKKVIKKSDFDNKTRQNE